MRFVMKFGCCASMIDPATDPVGIKSAEVLKHAGYDYIELSMRDMMKLSDAQFGKLREHLESVGLPCESCNNFLPPDIKVTGPDARHDDALSYSEDAFGRAGELGVKVVVFGSPLSRDVDVDFDKIEAEEQTAEFLLRLDAVAQARGVTVAVEHVNEFDGILFADARDTLSLVRKVARPAIRLLIDYFHMRLQREPPDVIKEAGGDIRHVHFSRIYKRLFPKDMREDQGYGPFFSSLLEIGYAGRVSVEAYPRDFASDAARTLHFLKRNLT